MGDRGARCAAGKVFDTQAACYYGWELTFEELDALRICSPRLSGSFGRRGRSGSTTETGSLVFCFTPRS
jgi:hypothetical protein